MHGVNLTNVLRIQKRGQTKEQQLAYRVFRGSRSVEQLETRLPNSFNYRVEGELDVLDQKQTGRCWIFACISLLRTKLIHKLNLSPKFTLSPNYVNFWALFEKSHSFLNRVHTTRDRPLDDRYVSELISSALEEGSSWAFASQLIEKYGVVPMYAMPDTWASANSSQFLRIINKKLGQLAKRIRENDEFTIDAYMEEVYDLLCIFLGTPPRYDESIVWEYENCSEDEPKKSKKRRPKSTTKSRNLKFKRFEGTPCALYRQTGVRLKEMVELTDYPNLVQPARYRIKGEADMYGECNTFLNVDTDTMTNLATRMITKRNQPVWVAVDFEQYFGGPFLSTPQLDEIYPFRITMQKADSVRYQDLGPSHAMLLRAVHIDDATNEPVRWQVHNSHGEESGNKGEFIISNEWFRANVLKIVVHQSLLSPSLRKHQRGPIRELDFWEVSV